MFAMASLVLLAAALRPAGGEAPPPWFEDVALRAGLDFVHFNGMTGELYFPEMTGQGGALLDYDGDGDVDVYLVQGSLLASGDRPEDALFPPPELAGDRLFRNDLSTGASGAVELRFVDVTRRSGLRATGYGMGVATGDVDGDGWIDLYVTHYGPNRMWRNRGDGTFEDVTALSGTGDPLWGTSATFFDADGDGDQDLFVVNYVEFDVESNPRCYATSSRRDYCGPSAFPPQPDRLYLNRGGGRFEEVAARLLVEPRAAPGLGVAAADLDGDGRTELLVANDGDLNQLWVRGADGRYRDRGLVAGVAVNRDGRAEAGMGVAVADYDGDGDEDVFMAHLDGETNTLYRNEGGGQFEDRTRETGLGPPSLPYTGFGAGWLDVDNDGRLDLVVVNGAVRILERQVAAGDPFPLKQPNQLFVNRGGRFETAGERAGAAFVVEEVSRGLALGDVDNDGDVDLLVRNHSGPARLLVNRVGQSAGWVGLSALAGPRGGPLPGVAADVLLSDGRRARMRSRTDGSYCSASDPRIVGGLGAASPEALSLVWPGGRRQRIERPPAGAYLVAFARPAARETER